MRGAGGGGGGGEHEAWAAKFRRVISHCIRPGQSNDKRQEERSSNGNANHIGTCDS